MSDVVPQPMHAFNHAPAALRIFRFAADSAPRVLELAHVSAFLRECAVEFGSADAALPGALRNEYISGRYVKLHHLAKCYAARRSSVVEGNRTRSPWLAEKILACRGGAPIPAAALAPDVTRHDVNWGAEGARRGAVLRLTHGGFGLYDRGSDDDPPRWAQGAVAATMSKHFFQVCVTAPRGGYVMLGWVDKTCCAEPDNVGWRTNATGAAFDTDGAFWFGTAPLTASVAAPDNDTDAPSNKRPCVIGALLDLDATPARMTVFVDGEPLAVQCEYDFPKDGRAWFPSVGLYYDGVTALHSCAM
jgi:hypothetical protein